jgi:UDP-N-acetyl-D-galactosamine dehydrogenase
MDKNNINIAIVGLGYVGLPLAVEFSKTQSVTCFDISKQRIADLKSGKDLTMEISREELSDFSHNLIFTSDEDALKNCNVFIVTVPTPINSHKQPDLRPLIKASEMIGGILQSGSIVIFESTVYPGATEEICVPVLEKFSGYQFNVDFFVGYSPERINPGDKQHKLTSIIKITSGSTPEVASIVDNLYSSIIEAGTYPVSSIKIAEAAKVIENTQRDVNIGLINELAMIFNKLDINTEEVLNAAGTKWNFLSFKPGLVGGHCIGVDPYYLTHKAVAEGYHPELILSGRRVNDGMSAHISNTLVKSMIQNSIQVKDSRILVMGLSFKENCPDIRNTKVVDIINDLNEFGASVECYDPWVNYKTAKEEFDLELISEPTKNYYDAILLAVGHKCFLDLGISLIKSFAKTEHIIYDLKYLFPKSETDLRL